jgi:hypothetical protein
MATDVQHPTIESNPDPLLQAIAAGHSALLITGNLFDVSLADGGLC